MYTKLGQSIISIVLGLGMASLFRNFCKDKDCFEFKGGPFTEIVEHTYKYNDSCYKFKEHAIKCGNKQRSVVFS